MFSFRFLLSAILFSIAMVAYVHVTSVPISSLYHAVVVLCMYVAMLNYALIQHHAGPRGAVAVGLCVSSIQALSMSSLSMVQQGIQIAWITATFGAIAFLISY